MLMLWLRFFVCRVSRWRALCMRGRLLSDELRWTWTLLALDGFHISPSDRVPGARLSGPLRGIRKWRDISSIFALALNASINLSLGQSGVFRCQLHYYESGRVPLFCCVLSSRIISKWENVQVRITRAAANESKTRNRICGVGGCVCRHSQSIDYTYNAKTTAAMTTVLLCLAFSHQTTRKLLDIDWYEQGSACDKIDNASHIHHSFSLYIWGEGKVLIFPERTAVRLYYCKFFKKMLKRRTPHLRVKCMWKPVYLSKTQLHFNFAFIYFWNFFI